MHVFRKVCLDASLRYPAVYPRELIEGRSMSWGNVTMSVSSLHQSMGVAVTQQRTGATLRYLYLDCTSPRVLL